MNFNRIYLDKELVDAKIKDVGLTKLEFRTALGVSVQTLHYRWRSGWRRNDALQVARVLNCYLREIVV